MPIEKTVPFIIISARFENTILNRREVKINGLLLVRPLDFHIIF